MSDKPTLPKFELPEHRARRYAAALAAAAAADSRVEELTEKLATADWLLQQAEMTVDAYKEMVSLGTHQVIDGTDEEPKARAIVSLWSGRVWVHPLSHDNEEQAGWILLHRDSHAQTRYEWPISDEGPFIGLPDGWDLEKQNRDMREADILHHRLHEILRVKDGYRDPDKGGYAKPPLDQALARVLMKYAERADEWRGKYSETQRKLEQLERLNGLLRNDLDAERAKSAEVSS